MIKVSKYLFGVAKFNSNKNYYKILNLTENASPSEIKKGFHKLAKLYHPDSIKGKQEQFKQINQAYQILSSPTDKQQYDRARRGSAQNNTYSNYSDSKKQYTSETQHNPDYRGYRQQKGWNNAKYRDQVIYEMFKAQQERAYQQRSKFSSFQKMYQNKKFNQKYSNQMNQQTKIKKENIKKAFQQQSRRRQQEFKEFREKINITEEAKKKVQKMAEGFIDNIKGFQRIGSFLKDLWSQIKKKK